MAIGKDAFNDCDSLTSVTIPGSVKTIGERSFQGCNNLISLTIGENVVSIGNNAFDGCAELPSVVIPGKVRSIGDYAFMYCYALASLTLGDHVETIGMSAFFGAQFTSVGIPGSVTQLTYSFAGCNQLTSIDVDPGNEHFASVDGVLYNKGITTLIKCPSAKTGAFTIPDTVTYLDNSSFSYCSLTSVIVPDSVTSLGRNTFCYSNHLASITIPPAVAIIPSWAFGECHALASITFDASAQIMWIGPHAFDHCINLTSIVLPESVQIIYDYAFYFCTNLTSITIPDSVRTINWVAFGHCTNLTSIVIPDAVTTIYQSTFEYCTNLASVSIGSGMEHIFERAFYYCSSLDHITIPANVKKIDGEVFRSCTSLTSISFLGLTALTDVVNSWIMDTPASIRGHAYPTSDFPLPGGTFHGLTMGSQLPLTVPDAPRNLDAAPGLAKAFLTWDAPYCNGGSNITNYNVYRSTTSGGTYTLISSPADLNLTDSGLTNGQTYWYKVSAVNAIGEGANCTAVNATPSSVITVPGAPRNLVLDEDNDTVYATWQAPINDGGSPITGYRLYRSTTANGVYDLIASPTDLSYTDPGLVNGTSYFYKVSAVNAVGEGANCTPVGTFITTEEPTVPGNPEGLAAIANNATVVLTWSAPFSDGGSPITGYRLYRSTTSDGTYNLVTSTSGLNYTDTDVSDGHAYWYKVSAVNAVGEGAQSAAVSVDVPQSGSAASDSTMLMVGAAIAIIIVLAVVVLLLRTRKTKK